MMGFARRHSTHPTRTFKEKCQDCLHEYLNVDLGCILIAAKDRSYAGSKSYFLVLMSMPVFLGNLSVMTAIAFHHMFRLTIH